MSIETEKTKQIPTSEVLQDIKDTKAEIVNMQLEVAQLATVAAVGNLDRLADMKLRAKKSGIEDRQAFVKKLLILLESRTP